MSPDSPFGGEEQASVDSHGKDQSDPETTPNTIYTCRQMGGVPMRGSLTRLGHYLEARRAVVQPETVGLPRDPGRRVRGLRREEVASLAGTSAEYYLRLEQGRAKKPSLQVVMSIARALLLDADATTYLLELVHHSRPSLPLASAPVPGASLALVDDLGSVGALLLDTNLDVVTMNVLASTLIAQAQGAARSPWQLRREGEEPSGGNVLVEMIDSGVLAPTLDATTGEIISVFRYLSDPSTARHAVIVEMLEKRLPNFAEFWERYDVRLPHPIDLVIPQTQLGPVHVVLNVLLVPTSPHLVITLNPRHPQDRTAFAYFTALADA